MIDPNAAIKLLETLPEISFQSLNGIRTLPVQCSPNGAIKAT